MVYKYLIFGSVICFTHLLLSILIKLNKISAKKATVFLFIIVFLFTIIIELYKNGDYLQVLCLGLLLTIAFGPASYFFYKLIEKRRVTH